MQSKHNYWCDWESIRIEELSGIEHGIITEGMVHSMFGFLGASLSKVAAVGLDRQRTLPRSSDMTTRSGASYNQTEPDIDRWSSNGNASIKVYSGSNYSVISCVIMCYSYG